MALTKQQRIGIIVLVSMVGLAVGGYYLYKFLTKPKNGSPGGIGGLTVNFVENYTDDAPITLKLTFTLPTDMGTGASAFKSVIPYITGCSPDSCDDVPKPPPHPDLGDVETQYKQFFADTFSPSTPGPDISNSKAGDTMTDVEWVWKIPRSSLVGNYFYIGIAVTNNNDDGAPSGFFADAGSIGPFAYTIASFTANTGPGSVTWGSAEFEN